MRNLGIIRKALRLLASLTVANSIARAVPRTPTSTPLKSLYAAKHVFVVQHFTELIYFR